MMKANQFVAAAAVLLPFAAFAQSPTPEPADQPQSAPAQSQGTTFESLDVNSDGKISKAEAEANANVKAQFSAYDQNGDGFIERAEVNRTNTAPAESPQQK